MKLSGASIAHFRVIYRSRKMKVSLIIEKNNCVLRHVMKRLICNFSATKSRGLSSCTTLNFRDEILALYKAFVSQNKKTTQQQLHVCGQSPEGIAKQKALVRQGFEVTLLFVEAQVFLSSHQQFS